MVETSSVCIGPRKAKKAIQFLLAQLSLGNRLKCLDSRSVSLFLVILISYGSASRLKADDASDKREADVYACFADIESTRQNLSSGFAAVIRGEYTTEPTKYKPATALGMLFFRAKARAFSLASSAHTNRGVAFDEISTRLIEANTTKWNIQLRKNGKVRFCDGDLPLQEMTATQYSKFRRANPSGLWCFDPLIDVLDPFRVIENEPSKNPVPRFLREMKLVRTEDGAQGTFKSVWLWNNVGYENEIVLVHDRAYGGMPVEFSQKSLDTKRSRHFVHARFKWTHLAEGWVPVKFEVAFPTFSRGERSVWQLAGQIDWKVGKTSSRKRLRI